MKRTRAIALSVVVAAAGCGGGGLSSLSGGPASSSEHVSMGQITADYSGIVKPALAAGSGNVTVGGLAGASFNNVAMSPAKTLANTTIVFTDNDQSLWTYANGAFNEIGGYGQAAAYAVFNPNGLIGFVSVVAGAVQIFTCNYDGSGVHQLTSYPGLKESLSWSPNGQKIAYDDGYNIWVVNSNGSSPVKLTTGQSPCWSPDGSHIGYEATDPATFAGAFWIIPAAGGTPVETAVGKQYGPGTAWQSPSWSNNGSVAFRKNSTPGTIQTFFFDQNYQVQSSNQAFMPLTSTASYFSPSFAPDGIHLVCAVEDTNTLLELCLTDPNGAQQQWITPDPKAVVGQPQWSPYPSPKTFVGTGGAFSTTAAGFLYALNGDAFGSFLSFTATTPSTATVTAQSQSGAGSLLFQLQADSIGTLKYQDVYYGQINSITVNAPQTLVSISSQTGQIDTVVPALAATRVTERSVGAAIVVYRGRFPAIYDRKGKNLTSAGATQVEFDAKTGKLLRFS